MRASHLADDERLGDIRLPPFVNGKTPVVVLGADGDLQRLGVQVDIVLPVNLNGRGVHQFEPLDGQLLRGPGGLQITAGLIAQIVEAKGGHSVIADGVLQKIHEDAAAFLCLIRDGDVDQRGLEILDSLRIEGPLITLEKDIRRHTAHRREKVRQEFARIAAVGASTINSRDNLHVCSRHIPAELRACQTELRFGKVLRSQSGLESDAVYSGLAERIHACLIQCARAAGGQYEVVAVEYVYSVAFAVQVFPVQTYDADDPLIGARAGRQKLGDLAAVKDGDRISPDDLFETFGHEPARTRSR